MKILLTLVASIFCMCCDAPDDIKEKKEPEKKKKITYSKVALYNAHGLWGGCNFYIEDSGKILIQNVRQAKKGEAGLQDERYSFKLDKKKLQELYDLITKNKLKDLEIKKRMGRPDEMKPKIQVIAKNGSFTKSKWAGDKVPRFDAVFTWILSLKKNIKDLKPEKTVPYDYKWKAEGF